MGFKRSEKRMKKIEAQLREGMARQGITGDAAQQIITSIASFALYGFPESHAASFALLAYASAYLKAHFPAAFYTALLNNQPMGFYHPSTLVKDAQRRSVRFHPIDVQVSGWDCTVEADGAIRLGLRYVNGLRAQVGKAIEACRAVLKGPHSNEPRASSHESRATSPERCPKCGCDDPSMLECDGSHRFCNNCSHDWDTRLARAGRPAQSSHGPRASSHERFASLDELVARVNLRRDELVTLADIGALNAFGYDRRSALWQVEQAVRPSGELFDDATITAEHAAHAEISFEEEDNAAFSASYEPQATSHEPRSASHESRATSLDDVDQTPLRPMTEAERLVADYAGTGLTIGRHPMALRRDELAMRGVLRACDLRTARQGRRVRVAGMVITRQRPGTAKGFVFLTLEDETGVANIIVRPDLFARDRLVIVEEPFLLVDGVLQNQDGVTSVRAEQVRGLARAGLDFEAHDFY
jgi:error-prone DNA polymerase